MASQGREAGTAPGTSLKLGCGAEREAQSFALAHAELMRTAQGVHLSPRAWRCAGPWEEQLAAMTCQPQHGPLDDAASWPDAVAVLQNRLPEYILLSYGCHS